MLRNSTGMKNVEKSKNKLPKHGTKIVKQKKDSSAIIIKPRKTILTSNQNMEGNKKCTTNKIK
jgi:hypothetical protein